MLIDKCNTEITQLMTSSYLINLHDKHRNKWKATQTVRHISDL